MANVTDLPAEQAADPNKYKQRKLDPLEGVDRLLRISEVEKIAGLSRAAIYARMKEGKFPQGVSLGANCTRWRLSDVTDWFNAICETTTEAA